MIIMGNRETSVAAEPERAAIEFLRSPNDYKIVERIVEICLR